MKRKCDSCGACELLKDPVRDVIGHCHQGPPQKVVYTDGVNIEFVGVTAGFYCRQHKFRPWSWRWVASGDLLKFWR